MPDPPEREPDDMTSFNHLSVTGGPYLLTHHFGNPDTTLIGGEHYISREPTHDMEGLRYPDLLIAFDVDLPAAYYRSNAYIISEQGKPPDFVLEIASHATGRQDTREKQGRLQLRWASPNIGGLTKRADTKTALNRLNSCRPAGGWRVRQASFTKSVVVILGFGIIAVTSRNLPVHTG